jgi:hypothetical protein
MNNNDRGIITIAIGKRYINQAKYLALSCMLHVPHIPRAVVTDGGSALRSFYDHVIPYNSGLGNPFETKTRLPLYTPFVQTLYIDADSLVIADISSLWAFLGDRSFVYEGRYVNKGTWYGDIGRILEKTGIEGMPQFNSGMILFDSSERAKSIFSTAYGYMKNQGDLDIGYFRGDMLPDEPFFSIALAKHGEGPIEDLGRFSRTLIGAEKIHINVLRGTAVFIKEGKPVYPLIVHFCGRFARPFYFFEKLKLFFYFNPPVRLFFGNLFVLIRNLFKGRKKEILP